MITVIQGGTGSGKTMRLIEIANEKSKQNNKVLIITLFSLEIQGLDHNNNIIIALSSDVNLSKLIESADVIMIDESYHVFKHEQVDLGNLENLGKDVYYTVHKLLPGVKYDNIIEVDWKSTQLKLFNESQLVFPDCEDDEKINAYLIRTITGNNYMFVSEQDINAENFNFINFNKTIDTGKISPQRIDTEAKFELTVINEKTLIPTSSIEFIKVYQIYKNRLVY